jgi:hypothetical protein
VSAELKNKVKLILELLEQVATKEVVVNFLKGKGLPFSGSWAELVEKRVLPAVDDGKVTIEELTSLLAASEEHGRQHIFLYRLNEDSVCQLSEELLLPRLAELGLDGLIGNPEILNEPENATISDIRWDAGALVVKVISKLSKYEAVDETQDADGFFVKRYKVVSSRVVSVVKVNVSGLVEIKISSKHNSTRYAEDVLSLLNMLKAILPMKDIIGSPVSLYASKTGIWERRGELAGVIRFSDATLKNSLGYSLKAATPTRDYDLLEDEGVNTSMTTFQGRDIYCDTNNIFFKSVEGCATPSKEVHVLMSGEGNEFAITTYCKDEDYNYVLRKIIEFNE